MKVKYLTILILTQLILWIPIQSKAQEEAEYKMEIGGALGGSFYMGDANYTTPFKHFGPAGGVIYRYVLNPHMAIKGDFLIGRIAGNTKDFETKYPNDGQASFKRALFDLGAQFEYNFLEYGLGYGFKGGHRIVPYITGGIGMTFAPAPAKAVTTVNVPLGAGVKFKLAPRWNMGLEFTMRFSMSDNLDVTQKNGLQLKDPYNIKGKGWKNKDSYSFLLFSITYDFFAKCRECNN